MKTMQHMQVRVEMDRLWKLQSGSVITSRYISLEVWVFFFKSSTGSVYIRCLPAFDLVHVPTADTKKVHLPLAN